MKGFDCSNYQNNINWAKMKENGYEIVFIKITEGISYTNPIFKLQYAGARKAGLLIGAYHFLQANNPVAEAKHFLSAIAGMKFDCKHCIDAEIKPVGVSARVRAFADYLISQGKEPLLYTGLNFYNNEILNSCKDFPVWIAKYGGSRPSIKPSVGWQWDGDPLDLNVFDEGVLLTGVKTVTTKINDVASTTKVVLVPPEKAIQYATVLADNLNIRKDSSVSSAIIGNLKKGDKIRIGSKRNKFTAVYFSDNGGWVSSQYIDDGSVANPVKAVTPIKTNGIVNTNCLNVRSQPNATSKIAGTLKRGTAVVIRGKVGNFYLIHYEQNGFHGCYVSCDFIK